MIVPRQDYEKDEMAAVVPVMEESLSDSLEKIETSHNSRSGAVMESLNVALVRCVGDPGAVMLETWESWLLAMQVHSAVFAAAAPDRETVTCKIRQEKRHLATTGPQTYADTWLDAFYLAVICREATRLDMLARIPVSLLRDFGGALDEYTYAWVETLQSFWLRRDALCTHLVRAVDLSAPEHTRVVDAETMTKLRYPPIMMLYRYLRNDAMRLQRGPGRRRPPAQRVLHRRRGPRPEHPGGRSPRSAGDRLPGEGQRHPGRGRDRLPTRGPPRLRLAWRVRRVTPHPT